MYLSTYAYKRVSKYAHKYMYISSYHSISDTGSSSADSYLSSHNDTISITDESSQGTRDNSETLIRYLYIICVHVLCIFQEHFIISCSKLTMIIIVIIIMIGIIVYIHMYVSYIVYPP
jgi:hypothetical protein